MATSLKNLSEYSAEDIPSGNGMKIGIVLAEWNYEITGALMEGAVSTLLKHGVQEENISIEHVPGSFDILFPRINTTLGELPGMVFSWLMD